MKIEDIEGLQKLEIDLYTEWAKESNEVMHYYNGPLSGRVGTLYVYAISDNLFKVYRLDEKGWEIVKDNNRVYEGEWWGFLEDQDCIGYIEV